MKINELTERIVAAAIEVHRELGPGLRHAAPARRAKAVDDPE
jgi:hypothetical protein